MREGDHIGPYILSSDLGRGGFGWTWRATDKKGDVVALKTLQSFPGARQVEAEERFRRELEAGQTINSKFVARILDFDTDGSPPWIAFTYIPGRTLFELVLDAPLETSRVESLARQLAAALRDVHAHGLVHRDVKPENVLVGANDSLTLIDLGIAWQPDLTTITQAAGIGTTDYMPPESHSGAVNPTPAWDIWAFGLILAQLAGRSHPFGHARGSHARMIAAVLTEAPRVRDLPFPFKTVVQACLSRDPDARPSAAQLTRFFEPSNSGLDWNIWWSDRARQHLHEGDLDKALGAAAVIVSPIYLSRTMARIVSYMGEGHPASGMATEWNSERALQVVQTIQAPRLREKALIELVQQVAEADEGDVSRAQQVVDVIADMEARDFAVCRITSVLQRRGHLGEALSLADSVTSSSIRDGCIRAMAYSLSSPEYFPLVNRAARRIDDPVIRAEFLEKVAERLMRRGDTFRAQQLANSIVDPAGFILARLVENLAVVHQFDNALDLAESIQDPELRATTVGTVAKHMARADLTKALKVVDSIEEDEAQRWALGHVAAQIASQDLPEALELAHSITTAKGRDDALGLVAQQLARKGETAAALELADCIEASESRDVALLEIVKQLARRKNPAEALELLPGIGGPHVRTSAMWILAWSMVRYLGVDKASRGVESIEDPRDRVLLKAEVAQALARAGEVDAAVVAANSIDDPQIRQSTLAGIAPWRGRYELEEER